MTDKLTLRVAARAKTAGFIPDKFWRTQKTQLRKILSEPLNANEGAHIAWRIRDVLIPFFNQFMKKLEEFGVHQFAEQTIEHRIKDITDRLEKIAEAYGEFHKQSDQVSYTAEGAEDQTIWTIQVRIGSLLNDKVKTLKDALKGVWKTDARLIRGLAQRLLKKATPEERTAIEQSAKEDYGPSSRKKWEFFERVNLDAAVKRIVSVDKKTWKIDPVDWIDWLQQVLAALHTEDQLEAFSQFDLYGVKVVVDDTTVEPSQVRLYVRYFDTTYNLLKSKHLEKVWYGTFFVRCEDCGGFNPNTGKWKDVGGNYPIGPDVVNVFSRPSTFIVELIAHELGHRYWFKFMNQTQRGKFESLVKVHKSPRPSTYKPTLISDAKRESAKAQVNEAAAKLRKVLLRLEPKKGEWFADIIRKNVEDVGRAGWEFGNDMLDAVHSAGADSQINDEVKQLFKDFLASSSDVQKTTLSFEQEVTGEIHREPEPETAPANRDEYWMKIYERVLNKWFEKVNLEIDAVVADAHIYIDYAALAYNKAEENRMTDAEKKWNEEYETDPREVTPVSDYGKSNIEEAFAEVFAHYIMNYDMSRGQIESFKSVLSSERVSLFEAFLRLL